MQEKTIDKIRLGILRGGQGDHYESSLERGGHILSHIFENLSHKIKLTDILIDTDGVWHQNGLPIRPIDLIHNIDAVWNLGHSNISNVLNSLAIPNISENPFHSLLKDNRVMMKEHFKESVLNIPKHIILPVYQKDIDGPKENYATKKAKQVFEKFSSPWIVRAFSRDKNVGVHVANNFEELVNAIEDVSSHGESILVEELISGQSASVHGVAGFRGEDLYTFPILGFSKEDKEEILNLSKKIYKEYFHDARYTRLDFIVHKTKGVYLVNVDFSPDFKENSNFLKACESVGAKASHVIEHLIENAVK